MKRIVMMAVVAMLIGMGTVRAQLNQSGEKFLGNITTRGQVEPGVGDLKYEKLWDQLTCENECKWGSIVNCKVGSAAEGMERWNWKASDAHYEWCKAHGVTFKFHCLLWTSQFPRCLKGVTGRELREQVEYWMDAVAAKYPDVALIDVVNEAIRGHAEGGDGALALKRALSQALGNSDDPYDFRWIAEAFRMARKRFPHAILIYNDYNTFTHQKEEFIDLVSSLVRQGAPIDAYGHQAHDLDDYYKSHGNSMSGFEENMRDIHTRITEKGGRELRCYITEYDINQEDDSTQLAVMQGSFPAMWEADFVDGITFWGYVSGMTWQRHTGLVTAEGSDRSSMAWLRRYMASDKARNTTSCGRNGAGSQGASARDGKRR